MEQFNWVVLLFSLVENTLVSLLILSLLALKINYRKLLLMVVSVSLVVLTVRTFPVTPVILVFTGLLVYTILLHQLFKVNYFIGGVMSGISIIIYLLIETSTVPLFAQLTAFDLNYFLDDLLYRTLFFLPQVAVMLLIICLVRKYALDFQSTIKFLSREDLELETDQEIDLSYAKKINNTMSLLTLFLIFQGLFLLAIYWGPRVFPYFYKGSSIYSSPIFLNTISVLLLIVILALIRQLVEMLKLQRNDMIERIKEKVLQQMNWELRMQYHDYNHHLGMINVMLKMNQVEAARKYLKGIVTELEQIEEVVRTGNQTLNALLYSKISRAKVAGVNVKVNTINQIKELGLSNWDLNRIIGNLLDNAIEALGSLEDGDKTVEVIIDGGTEENRFEVKTMGIVIKKEIEERLFERGYTTKKEKGHGLGLAICQELVNQNRGKLLIEKDQFKKYTSFISVLPIRKTS